MSALETVVKALNTLQPPRSLTVHLLRSEPRRTNTLYAHLADHPKGTTVQDVLLVLYIHLESTDLSTSPSGDGNTDAAAAAAAAAAPVSSAAKPDIGSSGISDTNPIALVAVQAQIFSLPKEAHTIVYISKADSTGYTLPSSLPSRPYARTIISSLLSYYLSPQSRPTPTVQVHLFARSQRQYLFPDSGLDPEETEGKNKKILSGGALCKWWSDVLMRSAKLAQLEPKDVNLGCFLPGLSKGETLNTLGRPTEFTWSTDLKNVPHPLHNQASGSSSATPSLASTVPTFDDDPRTRFLVELSTPGAGAGASSVLASSSALPSLSSNASSSSTTNPSDQPKKVVANDKEADLDEEEGSNKSLAARTVASARLSAVPQDEFYERLAFRQECSLGSQVGFFILTALPPSPSPSLPPSSSDPSDSKIISTSAPNTSENQTQSKRRPGDLPKNLFIRLLSMLLNQSFSSNPLVVSSSKIIWDSIRGLTGEWGVLDYVEGSIQPTSLPVDNDNEGSSKRKRADVNEQGALTGQEAANNAPQPVTVLQVRKKKKKVDP